jgi:hypothetical protein
MDENTPDSRLQERFVRWQQALRDSLSSHVALIVALSSAGVGIAASMLNAEHAVFAPCPAPIRIRGQRQLESVFGFVGYCWG